MIRSQNRLPGVLGEELDKIWTALESIQVVDSPTVRAAQRGSKGTTLEALAPALSGAVKVVGCNVTREGADALKCRFAGALTDTIVAKPFNLQAFNAGQLSNAPLHARDFVDLALLVSDAVGLYTSSLDPLVKEFRRFAFITGTAFDGGSTQTVEQVIEPPYTYMQADQDLPPGPKLLALHFPGILTVDPDTLAQSPGGVAVDYIDLNVDGRRWQKRTEAINSEATIEFPGIPTWLVREP